eukprot:COSAG05_NODE_17531_length_323_cov_1.808036_1_plen_42_part_10
MSHGRRVSLLLAWLTQVATETSQHMDRLCLNVEKHSAIMFAI